MILQLLSSSFVQLKQPANQPTTPLSYLTSSRMRRGAETRLRCAIASHLRLRTAGPGNIIVSPSVQKGVYPRPRRLSVILSSSRSRKNLGVSRMTSQSAVRGGISVNMSQHNRSDD